MRSELSVLLIVSVVAFCGIGVYLNSTTTGFLILPSDSVQVGSPTDILEINEPLGSVRQTYTENDLTILKGGIISTQKGSTKYKQYLKFNTSAPKVIFGENEYDNVGSYLNIQDSAMLFEYNLVFEEGLRSSVESGKLINLNDRSINILGRQYVIADTNFNGNIELTLLGGDIVDMGEGDVRNINRHQIKIIVVSDSTNEVLLSADGRTLPRLRAGDAYQLNDGTVIGIRDIIATGKDTQSSLVRLFTSANKLRFKDNDYSDNAFSVGGISVNDQIITDSAVKIKATVLNNIATIESITYRLFASAKVGDVNTAAGTGIRSSLRQPQAMLSPNFDIKYQGLADVQTNQIIISPSGKDEYKLEFTNQRGNKYRIPLMSVRESGSLEFGTFTGESQRNLVFIEGASSADYKIKKGDYFIVSNAGSGNSGFTHVYQYSNYDTTNNVLTFKDMSGSGKQITLNSNNQGSLIAGGDYAVFFDPTTGNIAVDLNGDGGINGGSATIATQGGGLISLGSSNPTSGSVGSTNTITLTTLSRQFDSATSNAVTSITLEARSGNIIGIQSISPITFTYLTSNPSIGQAMDNYGTFYEFYNPGNAPDKLTIAYPMSQRGVKVSIGN